MLVILCCPCIALSLSPSLPPSLSSHYHMSPYIPLRLFPIIFYNVHLYLPKPLPSNYDRQCINTQLSHINYLKEYFYSSDFSSITAIITMHAISEALRIP